MGTGNAGILQHRIQQTPMAVLDLETTGLTPGSDRVVEVSVARVEPGREPELVYESLINPGRPMAATDIHGITDQDVADAPPFEEIAGDLARVLSDCVLAAYNVYFDIRFLRYELERAGLADELPHLCLMYMRTMLGLGKRCSLEDACRSLGVQRTPTHEAAADALAAAQLWHCYLDHIDHRNVKTFGELANLRRYKFVQSFGCPPLTSEVAMALPTGGRCKARSAFSVTAPTEERAVSATAGAGGASDARREYWGALKLVLADLEVSDEEMADLATKQQALGLADEQVRSLHARAFHSVIGQYIDDRWLDEKERRTLQRLHHCLSQLGWAPGQ